MNSRFVSPKKQRPTEVLRPLVPLCNELLLVHKEVTA